MKEQVVAKIRKIITDEKFKLDAFYLCGAPSGLPNAELQKACEKYIELFDKGEQHEQVTANLIEELEKALTTKPKITVVGDLTNNKADIQEVYDNRAYL